MTEYAYKVTTNGEADSRVDVLGHPMPAHMFVFVVVDEVGRDGFLVRNCYASVDSPWLKPLDLGRAGEYREVFPERLGLWGKGPDSTATIAEHVMGDVRVTSYASVSGNFPHGANRFEGKTVYIDIAAAKRSGARIITPEEIGIALDDYQRQFPHLKGRIARIKNYSLNLDNEFLIQPNRRVPPSGIFTRRGLGLSLGIVKYARVIQVVGIGFTAYDIGVATGQSFSTRSIRPIEKEVVRQIGGWGGATAGMKMGASAGALVGLETGPGTVITGLIGGIVFGAIGYFGGAVVADEL